MDERVARSADGPVLDWSLGREIRARNYVGVLQVPGLSIEILPKIDMSPNGEFLTSDQEHRAQRNLLYMLALTRRLPARERDFAGLATPRAPLLEALIRIFAESLLTELQRGADHAYVRREENCGVVRGRVLFHENLRRNPALPHRLFQAFEEFETDTPLNQILKATCSALTRQTDSAWTVRCLREALAHFAHVSDIEVRRHHLDGVQLHQNNSRFAEIFEFARIVLERCSAAPEAGDSHTFSLLFPMEKVFEEFIGAFIKRNAAVLGLTPEGIRIQSRGAHKWLLRSIEGPGHFRLKPDVLIGDANNPQLILDTKWKRMLPDEQGTRGGITPSDIYQLFAYAERYNCHDNVLLFPAIEGTIAKRYRTDTGKLVRIEFVNMSRDLFKERSLFTRELHQILRPTLVKAHAHT